MNRTVRSVYSASLITVFALFSYDLHAEPDARELRAAAVAELPKQQPRAVLAQVTTSSTAVQTEAERPPCVGQQQLLLPVYVPPSRGQATKRVAAATRGG